jgi:hypothetical protein
MAVTKTILKNTRTESVVKFVGTGTVALTLAELKLADETFVAGSASVDIRKVQLSSQATTETKVTRNAIDVLQLYGCVDWTFEGMKVTEQTDKDISITTVGDGTLILTLRKNAGYTAPNFRATNLDAGA